MCRSKRGRSRSPEACDTHEARRSWSRVERSKALIALCQKVAAANENAPIATPRGQQALRAIMRVEVSRAGLGTTINQTPQFDAAALAENCHRRSMCRRRRSRSRPLVDQTPVDDDRELPEHAVSSRQRQEQGRQQAPSRCRKPAGCLSSLHWRSTRQGCHPR